MSRLLAPLLLLAACAPDNTLTYDKDSPVEVEPGTISGRVCDPSGRTWLPNALAYVNLVDEEGVVYDTVQVTSDAEGRWLLADIPGEHDYVVYVQYGTDILMQEPIWLASGDDYQFEEPDCFDPLSLEIAVVTGDYDNFDVVLDSLGFINYTTIDGRDSATLSGFVGDPAALAAYDIIFFNGGHEEQGVIYGDSDGGVSTQIMTNIRDYVSAGGSVYASDWAYDAIEFAWPNAVDFFGDDTQQDAAQSAGNFAGLVDVLDTNLKRILGNKPKVQIESCCSAVDAPGPGTEVYLAGDRLNDSGYHPLMVAFQLQMGSGWVYYTDFHNHGQPDIYDVFRWLITKL